MVKDDIEQQIQDLLETNREKAVNTILAYVKENHRFLVEVHECMEKELISFRIYRPLADLVSQYIQNVLQENNVHIDEEYFRVLTHTFTIAAAALLLDWAYKYDKIEALQYDEYSYPLLENLIKTAILNPPKGEAE